MNMVFKPFLDSIGERPHKSVWTSSKSLRDLVVEAVKWLQWHCPNWQASQNSKSLLLRVKGLQSCIIFWRIGNATCPKYRWRMFTSRDFDKLETWTNCTSNLSSSRYIWLVEGLQFFVGTRKIGHHNLVVRRQCRFDSISNSVNWKLCVLRLSNGKYM